MFYINSGALYGNRKSKFEDWLVFLAINDSRILLVFLRSRPTKTRHSTMSGKKLRSMMTTKTLSYLPEGSRPHHITSSMEASESLTISAASPLPPQLTYDIEHVPVKNDPRAWSPLRKVGWPFLSRFGQLIPSMLERQSSTHCISRDDRCTGC